MTAIIERFSGSPNRDFGYLPDFDFKNAGDIVAIVGANGVGKSKLLEFLGLEIWAGNQDQRICYAADIDNPVVAHIPDLLTITERATNTIDSMFVGNLNRLMPAALAVIKETAMSASLSHDPSVNLTDDERLYARDKWKTLKDILDSFLESDIIVDPHGKLTFFGIELNEHNLSSGQARLVQLSVALSAIDTDAPIVVIWDEPELHLHSKAVIDVFGRLLNRFNCQIWFATHSLSLSAWAGIENIWYMDSKRIIRGHYVKAELIEALYGSDDKGARLSSFLNSNSVLAASNFAWECLRSPKVVSYSPGDRQGQMLFKDGLGIEGGKLPDGEIVRLLDWGAGKGRIIQAGLDHFNSPCDLRAAVDYFAYDISEHDRDECVRSISLAYDDASDRWINKEADLFKKMLRKSADVVTLINVLHEIPPVSWTATFRAIARILSADGKLVIVEDLFLSQGELANEFGYILLDESAFGILFMGDANDVRVKSSVSDDGRIIVASIDKIHLDIEQSNLKKCLKYCADKAITEVKDFRSEPGQSYIDGLNHMRSSMQFINAHLALQHL